MVGNIKENGVWENLLAKVLRYTQMENQKMVIGTKVSSLRVRLQADS
jgi:hypothetical protein